MQILVIVKKDSEFLNTFSFDNFVNTLNLNKESLALLHKKGGYEHSLFIYSFTDNSFETTQRAVHQAVLDKIFDFDVFCLSHLPNLNSSGVLVMDMDMTSVQIEGIDEIARALGLYDEIARLTEQAMQGHMDFNTSLTRRVALLKDGDAQVLDKVKEIMHETDGLSVLLETTGKARWGRGIASGGFTQLIEVLEHKYKLDMVRANTLEIKDGRFTGKVVGEIVNAQAKADAICSFAKDRGVSLENSVCIGDGANDLLMLKQSGLAVAYHAKPKVQQEVAVALNYSSLAAIALLLETMAC